MGSQTPSTEIDQSGATVAPPAQEADPLLGKTLAGRHQIDGMLGEGGIGRVYRATHLTLQRSVAVKVLLRSTASLEGVEARFMREAQTLAALHHPNIVTVIDFGVDQDAYLVLELAQGDELEALLEADDFAGERAIPVVCQLLDALAYAHTAGVIHRDLKPSNLFVRRLPSGQDHVEVLDFGLAKFADAEAPEAERQPKVTQVGQIVGTPAYMAPEQVSGSPCDARSDLYAASVVLFELLTGHLPFDAEDVHGWLHAHLAQAPKRLGDARPDLRFDERLEALVAKGLAKVPSDRFANAQEMLAALQELPAPEKKENGALPQPKAVEALASAGETLKSVSTRAKELLEERRVPAPPRWLVFGTGACLGVALLISLLGSDDAPSPAPSEPLPLGVETPAVDEAAESEPASLLADPLPRPLSVYAARLDAGRRLRRREIGTLRRFHRDHPQDPRPLLLHARAYVAQGWLSGALPLYVEASKLDAEVRNDPHMLAHILRMATTETLAEEAAEAFRHIYGEEGLPALDAAIAETSEAPRRARLEALRASID